jgi:hypothetical protein
MPSSELWANRWPASGRNPFRRPGRNWFNPDTNVAKGLTVPGELEQPRPSRRELGTEAARLGESFGLGGPPQGAYRARRRSTQGGCGTSMLVTAAVLAIVIPELQHRLTSLWAIVVGAVTVGGLLLMAFAPRSKWAISRAGLGYQPRIGRNSWWLAWPEVRTVKAHGPGRGLYIHPTPQGRGKRWITWRWSPTGSWPTASSSTRPSPTGSRSTSTVNNRVSLAP